MKFNIESKLKIKNLKFLGYVSELEKQKLLRESCCLVLISKDEGFGLPILEAMACGCPVLASSTSSIPEVAGDAAFYFKPHDKIEMASAIKKIVADSHLRQELIGRGWLRVKNFSWQKCAQETHQILFSK